MEAKRLEYITITSGQRHCYNYLDTVQSEEDDCTEIYNRLDGYANRMEVLLQTCKVCPCGKLVEKTCQSCEFCKKDFAIQTKV
jgi:hypothetical protein